MNSPLVLLLLCCLPTLSLTETPSCPYKCKSTGDCLKEEQVCDKKKDCSDESDESADVCARKINSAITPCKLPPAPKNGKYFSHACDLKKDGGCEDLQGGSVPNGFILHYKCNYGYNLKGDSHIYCAAGSWKPSIPYCTDECDPVASKKLIISCINRAKEAVTCDAPLPTRSKATFQCNPYSTETINNPEYSTITCRNGKWDRPLRDDFCRDICGKIVTHADLPSGADDPFPKFPWHASIYVFNQNARNWTQICGGSLISEKVVVSSAQCFHNKRAQKRDYNVAFGKYYKEMYDPRDKLRQVIPVKSINIQQNFRGIRGGLAGDIATVTLSEPVRFSAVVRPVCLDNDENSVEDEQLVVGAESELPGWGLSLKEKSDPEFDVVPLRVVNNNKCRKEFKSLRTADKICMEDKRSTVITCPNDVGGGLVFKYFDRYYLRGILSMPNSQCEESEHALFTKVSLYKEAIEGWSECQLPPIPEFGSYNIYYQEIQVDNKTSSVRTLNFNCLEGYRMVGKSSKVRCQDGEWYPEVPTCTNKCPALSSNVLRLDCYDAAGHSVRCNSTQEEGAAVAFKCNSKTHIQLTVPEYWRVTCRSAQWDNRLIEDFCGKKTVVNLNRAECPPWTTDKLQMQCTWKKNKVPCDRAMRNGTVVEFGCKEPVYRAVTTFPYTSVTCVDGDWTAPLPESLCYAECGKMASTKFATAINKGHKFHYGEFPWHVGLYEDRGGVWELICGGSLINSRVVITAAHCVVEFDSDLNKHHKAVDRLLVGVGKYYRDINSKEDRLSKIHKVKAISSPWVYAGRIQSFLHDIAAIVLEAPVQYNAVVSPVCLDVDKKGSFEEEQLFPGSVGKVVGWGKDSSGLLSEHLMMANLTFQPWYVCRNTSDLNIKVAVTFDKLCAGDPTSATVVCEGDSGGGLVFYSESKNAYYLRGVVSLGPDGCQGHSYGLFTKVIWNSEGYLPLQVHIGSLKYLIDLPGISDHLELSEEQLLDVL